MIAVVSCVKKCMHVTRSCTEFTRYTTLFFVMEQRLVRSKADLVDLVYSLRSCTLKIFIASYYI